MAVAVIGVVALLFLALAVAYWAVIRGRLGGRRIRTRLLYGFVLMALVQATAISAGSAAVGYTNGRRQVVDRLESVAARKASEIETWTQSVRSDLSTVLSTEYSLGEFGVVLNLATTDTYIRFYNGAVRNRLRRDATQSNLEELSLLDLSGRVVLSSDVAREGQSQEIGGSVTGGTAGISVEVTSTSSSDRDPWLRALTPVVDLNGQAIGALVARAGAQPLGDILRERTGLENTGKAYIVNSLGVLLIDEDSPAGSKTGGNGAPAMQSAGVRAALQTQGSGVEFYDDYRGRPVVGAYRWLSDLQAALLVEQDQSEAFQAVSATLAVNVGIALACVLLAVAASLGITRSISRPLVTLAGTAAQIAAGDLQQLAPVGGQDEVGALARAFNVMTAQLREFIGRLEERVAERTHALQRRALQLETSARVSREVTSILDIDGLLTRVVELIRSSFDYHHVSVYLTDKANAQLVLRASSGGTMPVNLRMPVDGAGIHGRSVLENRPVLVDGPQEATSFPKGEALPGIRSELVVPLRAGEEVIGTLDVRSLQEGAFAPEDVLVIQSLADQVAIAIENARLVQDTRKLATLEERQRLARELHDSVTQLLTCLVLFAGTARNLLDGEQIAFAAQQMTQVELTAQQALREMRLLLYQLGPSPLEQEGLVGALQRRLAAVEDRVGVHTQLVVDGELVVAGEIEEGLYRVAQEALNNALKHAMANSVTIRLGILDGRISLEIEDDGAGFDPAVAEGRGGLGMVSMRERAVKLGGTLEVTSSPGGGTRIRVEVAV